MKKFNFLVLFAVCASFAAFSSTMSVAQAHTIKTATGVVLLEGIDKPNQHKDHYHPVLCKKGTDNCSVGMDVQVESQYSFKKADRMYDSNNTWNCHGRTFDNRKSWIEPVGAGKYLTNDRPWTPITPAKGDSIIFWNGSYTLPTHSVTIDGSWNGNSTIVVSKYGAYGQYRHALSNTFRAYPGHKWMATRFAAGTTIYMGIADIKENAVLPFSRLLAFNGDAGILTINAAANESAAPNEFDARKFVEEQSQLPWYQEVMKEMPRFQREHDEMVQKTGKMSEANRKRLAAAKNDDERVKVLLEDLQDDTRFALLNLYSLPEQTSEFFEAMEAEKLLTDIIAKNKTVKAKAINELKKTAKNGSPSFGDQKKGMSIYLLGRVLGKPEKADLKQELGSASGLKIVDEESYEEFYLNRL